MNQFHDDIDRPLRFVRAARARQIHDLARHAAETMGVPTAIVVTDNEGGLMCASRTDGAERGLMAAASKQAAAVSAPELGFAAQSVTENSLTVVSRMSEAAERIVSVTIAELRQFDARHRYNLSSN